MTGQGIAVNGATPDEAGTPRFVATVPFPIDSEVRFFRATGELATGRVVLRRLTERVAYLVLALDDGARVDAIAFDGWIGEATAATRDLIEHETFQQEVAA